MPVDAFFRSSAPYVTGDVRTFGETAMLNGLAALEQAIADLEKRVSLLETQDDE